MHNSKKLELIKRRERLKLQHKFDTFKKSFSELLKTLDQSKNSYEVVYPLQPSDLENEVPYLQWLKKNFQFTSYGIIDSNHVTEHSEIESPDIYHNDGTGKFLSQLINENQIPNTEVIIFSQDSLSPILKMSLYDIPKISDELFIGLGWDNWLFDPASDWYIEYWHEGILSFGRSISDE